MIKRLPHWKTWIFVIVPMIMVLTYLGIMIWAAVVKCNNVTPIVLSQILLMAAVALFFCGSITKLIRRKAVWRVAAVSLCLVCFLGLQTIYTAKLIEYLEVSIKYETLKEEWTAIPYENRDEFQDKFDDLRQAGVLQTELSFTVDFLRAGSLVAFIVAGLCQGDIKKEEQEKQVDLQG